MLARIDQPIVPPTKFRRLYDSLVSVLDHKGQDFTDIRRVLESGMKNGAVSLMKDVSFDSHDPMRCVGLMQCGHLALLLLEHMLGIRADACCVSPALRRQR